MNKKISRAILLSASAVMLTGSLSAVNVLADNNGFYDNEGSTSAYYNITVNGGTWDGTYYTHPNGLKAHNTFFCDGTYTYYLQADGTPMKDRLTYHPDGKHVIYFDEDGHEVFSDFAHISKSIAGDDVDDMCFFDTYGYMYVDTLTYDKTGTKLYYVNPYGVLERNGWFTFSGHEFDAGLGFSGKAGGYGYANTDCSLMVNVNSYDWNGKPVYMQGDGHMAESGQTSADTTPHTHSYTSTVTKIATCTEEGIVTYTCSCGSSYTESVPTLSHSYGEYTYNNDATTENDGTKTATCAVCGATDTITAEGTKITEHTHQYDSYSEGNYGRATCTICGKTEWVHLPLPTEHCPYTLNTKIYNDDGTISFYYVDSNATDEKYGYNDGGAGNRAANDFDSWCEGNYYDRIGDDRVGDYAEGVVCELTAKPY